MCTCWVPWSPGHTYKNGKRDDFQQAARYALITKPQNQQSQALSVASVPTPETSRSFPAGPEGLAGDAAGWESFSRASFPLCPVPLQA